MTKREPETVCGYPLIRSDRKTVGITVRAGGNVQIRAPRRLPLAEIERAVISHRAWLEKTVSHCKTLPPPPDRREQEILRERAKALLPGMVQNWSQRTGLVPTSLRVTAARQRFGSCSGKNGLCFSLFLMQYPPEAIEYVVVHELCHIRHHNHSAAFWALVERYLPDYRERKQLLKKGSPTP